MIELFKFILGIFIVLFIMVNLEIFYVNVMIKIDLFSKKVKKEFERLGYICYGLVKSLNVIFN